MRLAVGIFSQRKGIALANQGSSGVIIIGETSYPASEVGTLRSEVAFNLTAPYLGLGFDFRAFDKASINLDLGVLWQDSPLVALTADGPLSNDPILRDAFLLALENERQELETALDSFKAYPVVSLGISFNF